MPIQYIQHKRWYITRQHSSIYILNIINMLIQYDHILSNIVLNKNMRRHWHFGLSKHQSNSEMIEDQIYGKEILIIIWFRPSYRPISYGLHSRVTSKLPQQNTNEKTAISKADDIFDALFCQLWHFNRVQHVALRHFINVLPGIIKIIEYDYASHMVLSYMNSRSKQSPVDGIE